jgi:hypothetical protein
MWASSNSGTRHSGEHHARDGDVRNAAFIAPTAYDTEN